MTSRIINPPPFRQIRPKNHRNDKNSNVHVQPQIEDTCCFVSVEFSEQLSTEQVVADIAQLSNPQVIIWYMGCYGLRETGVQFYRDFLIAPAFKQNAKTIFWLVDLSAWYAFKNSQGSIHKVNSCCNTIEKFLDVRIQCIKSATIFEKMQKISENDMLNYFSNALSRDFIYKSSATFPDKNILTREIFFNNCLIMRDWYDYDVSKSYSIFQYFEGCLLVDEIFTQLSKTELSNDIQIVFALPNDEIKYYKDTNDSFRKDIEFLISKRCSQLNIKNIHLQIKFLAFKYGSQLQHRPYNEGKSLSNSKLFYEDIVGKPIHEKIQHN